eukprot:6961052-Prymnesium_polylepis.1
MPPPNLRNSFLANASRALGPTRSASGTSMIPLHLQQKALKADAVGTLLLGAVQFEGDRAVANTRRVGGKGSLQHPVLDPLNGPDAENAVAVERLCHGPPHNRVLARITHNRYEASRSSIRGR